MLKIKVREIKFHCQVQRSDRVENPTQSQVRSQHDWKNGNRPGNKKRPGMVAAVTEPTLSLASLCPNLGSPTRVTTKTTGSAGVKPYHKGEEEKPGFLN